MRQPIGTFCAIALATGLVAGMAWGQTTYDGSDSNWNNDDWNNPANWDSGVPSGTIDAVIGASETPSVKGGGATPSYDGTLTIGDNASLWIYGDEDLPALGTNVVMNAGSKLVLVNESYAFAIPITLAGAATIKLSESTAGHHTAKTFNGPINGAYALSLQGGNNNTYNFNVANSFSSLIFSIPNNSRIYGNADGSLGTGDVTIQNSGSLMIWSTDAMADSGTLYLNGARDTKLSTTYDKLNMNVSDTINMLTVDGFPYPAGTYGRVGLGTVDYEYSWIKLNGILTVTSDPGDAVAPTVISFVDNVSGGPILETVQGLTYTVTFDEPVQASTVDASDFTNSASTTPSPITINSVTATTDPKVYTVSVGVNFPGGAGNLQLGLAATTDIKDLFGNTVVVSADDTTIVVNTDDVALVATIDSPDAVGTIYGLYTIPYTVSFLKYGIDDATVTSSDFVNAGTASITVGTVTRISAASDPAVYAFDVTPTSAGTVQLQITGTIQDMIPNTLVTPVTHDLIYTFSLGAEPTPGEITVDGVAAFNSSGSPVSGTLDASGSDKLVVVVTGEHGFPGHLGDCLNVTYDGVALTKAVDRAPVPGVGADPTKSSTDQTYNDIWYLDNPGTVHVAGAIVATVSTRGNVTAFALSGTASGVGATGISLPKSKSVDLFASKNSIVIASHGMGGDGNTANVANVNTVPPLIETSAQENGSLWDGHVTGYMLVDASTLAVPTFVGGNVNGTHTIAAEFKGVEIIPGGTLIMLK